MYEIRILGSIRGMETGMEGDFHTMITKMLKDTFGEHGLFEVFILERKIELPEREI